MASKGTSAYPTSYEIEDIFSNLNDPSTWEEFFNSLTSNCDAQIVGQDHHLAGSHRGKEGFQEALREGMGSVVDISKGITYEVLNVFGGGDQPWACVEGKSMGKGKTGKKWNHEHAYVIRFNRDRKIVKLRAYYDSHHTHSHMEEVAAKGANGTS